MKNKEIIIQVAYWMFWLIIVGICTFFIIFNAHWLIGDDAIVIRHTGMGKVFAPNDPLTFNKAGGRFFPFSYLAYDILLLFCHGYISPTTHYVLHAVFFVIFAVSITILSLNLLDGQRAGWKYSLSLLFVIVSIGRVFPLYIECFSTSWCAYTIVALFLLSLYVFYKEQKWLYGILALLLINYLCYCGESIFVLPLSMGTCALLFQRNSITSKDKVFCWILIGSALLFLVLYAILVLPYIQTAYDGAHGQPVGYVENALRMFWAQKILVAAFVLFVIRVVDMIKNKKQYTFFDNLLLTAAACCCGNFILRLNWTMYYNVPALLSLPAILYFSLYYIKERWTVVFFVLLALFYGRKIPTVVLNNQQYRKYTFASVTRLSEELDSVNEVYWYAPKTEEYSYELELRDWKYNALNSYLRWLRQDPDFTIPLATEFHLGQNAIWLTPSVNELLFPDDKQLQENGTVFFSAGSIMGYRIMNGE
jgi:hypothetical protein